MKRIQIQILIAGCLLFLVSACDTSQVFEDYQAISKNGWQKDSLVVFDVPITDTLKNHNLYVNVRNEISYQYSNLWLFIKISEPSGTSVTDTFELSLANPAGKWLGKGFGGLKTRQIIFKRNVYFPVSGNYKISIQQGMREENLSGISDIGFRVEKLQ